MRRRILSQRMRATNSRWKMAKETAWWTSTHHVAVSMMVISKPMCYPSWYHQTLLFLFPVNSSGSTSRQQPSRIIYSNNSSVYSMNSDTRGDGYGGGIVGSTSPMSRMSNVMPSSSGEEYPTAVIIDDATRGSIDNPNASHWQRQRALKNWAPSLLFIYEICVIIQTIFDSSTILHLPMHNIDFFVFLYKLPVLYILMFMRWLFVFKALKKYLWNI